MRLVEGEARVDDVETFVGALGDIGNTHGCAVQAFDARYVAGRRHLKSAVEHAERAFGRGENVARDRGVEVLLYAAGRRQINRALEMGVEPGTVPVVVVIVADDDDGGNDDGDAETREADAAAAVEGHLTPRSTLDRGDAATIRDFFEIGDAELDATAVDLEALVCERVALLDVEK